MIRERQDFLDILDGLIDQLVESGAVLPEPCVDALKESAASILAAQDVTYMPGYKVTELMADLVNIAASLNAEGWLEPEEMLAKLQAYIGDDSPVAQSFLSAAAMERARYEPVMLAERYESPLAERNAILHMRLKRIMAARQNYDPLPDSYVRAIRMAGHRAIHADCFKTYRIGPMLQFFDDMIKQADQIAETTFDEFEGLSMIAHELREDGKLWKLYRYKAPRFTAKPGDPLLNNTFTTRANMIYVPDTPGAPTVH
ncbi:MAG: hypothetical protein MRY32_04510 [Rickettsiales bacterium]|nr:hypothetical protein [Rickettsiales bacterium]